MQEPQPPEKDVIEHATRKRRGLPVIDSLRTRIVAYLQIGGGIIGLAMVLLETGNQPMTLWMYVMVLPFIFAVTAGFGLLRRTKMSLIVSRILWGAQVPVFLGSFLTYYYTLCFGLWVGFVDSRPLLDFFMGSRTALMLGSPDFKFGFGVDFFALLVFLYLLKVPLEIIPESKSKHGIFYQLLGLSEKRAERGVSVADEE